MVDLQEKSIELWREEAWELHGKLRAAETRIERLEAALRCCGELFSDIRNDWSDPRSECREGWRVIEEALEEKDD